MEEFQFLDRRDQNKPETYVMTAVNIACSAGVFWAGESCSFMFVSL